MRIRQLSSSLVLSRLNNSVPPPEIMKLTILIGFSLVLILLLNNICIGSEQDTEENALKNEIKNEIINPLSLVVVWTLIGTVVMYPILLLIPLIVAWIVLSGTVALMLFLIHGGPEPDTVATGGPNLFDGNYDNYMFYEGNPFLLDFVAIFIKSLFISPFLIPGILGDLAVNLTN